MTARYADNYQRRFKVELQHYHDGDSCWALIDLGFGVYSHHELRLYGLNAAEAHAVGGPEATKALEGWLAEHAAHWAGATQLTVDWCFALRSLGKETEKYGRYLVVVVCGQAHELNAFMLTQPNVVPMGD
jgi:hypothetical protein